MGYMRYDAIVAVTSADEPIPAINSLRDSMPEEFRQLLVGPVPTAINAGTCYVFLPDGSKEGWWHSDAGDFYRGVFRAIMEIHHAECASISFGGDFEIENEPTITTKFY